MNSAKLAEKKMADCDSLKVPYSRPAIGAEEERAVIETLRSGWLTTGKKALEFEEAFARKMNAVSDETKAARKNLGLCEKNAKCFAVNSNTSGMTLALDACGVDARSAVITTPYTFVSTAAVARKLGAEVFFADIESDSYNIDANKIEEILRREKNKNFRAIIPVHVGGNVCDMEAICALGKKYGARVVEDAAHSFPSPTRLGYAGSIADAGVFSFYVTKPITTGEGGMVCARDESIARRIVTMRMHGMDRATWDRYTAARASWEYDVIENGWKFNLPDLLATIGVEQLKKADALTEKRRRIAEAYVSAFGAEDFITPPPDAPGNSWHIYFLRLKLEKLKISRDEFARSLQARGVGVSVHFIPLFHFSYWKKECPDFRAENFPNAEKRYQETISIPLWPDMTREMVRTVIESVKEIGRAAHA